MTTSNPDKLRRRFAAYVEARAARTQAQVFPAEPPRRAGQIAAALHEDGLVLRIEAELDALKAERRALKRLRKALRAAEPKAGSAEPPDAGETTPKAAAKTAAKPSQKSAPAERGMKGSKPGRGSRTVARRPATAG